MTKDEFEFLKDKVTRGYLIAEIEKLREALQYYADNGGHVAKTALGYYEEPKNSDRETER